MGPKLWGFFKVKTLTQTIKQNLKKYSENTGQGGELAFYALYIIRTCMFVERLEFSFGFVLFHGVHNGFRFGFLFSFSNVAFSLSQAGKQERRCTRG